PPPLGPAPPLGAGPPRLTGLLEREREIDLRRGPGPAPPLGLGDGDLLAPFLNGLLLLLRLKLRLLLLLRLSAGRRAPPRLMGARLGAERHRSATVTALFSRRSSRRHDLQHPPHLPNVPIKWMGLTFGISLPLSASYPLLTSAYPRLLLSMRYSLFSLLCAASAALAISIVTPTRWTTKGPNTATFSWADRLPTLFATITLTLPTCSYVNTDPASFAAILVNQDGNLVPTSIALKANITTKSLNFTVTPSPALLAGSGYQIKWGTNPLAHSKH
ncbi:hypothetical protein P7C70_g8659, partial [Phenoliferia sp. Uapishka_3]